MPMKRKIFKISLYVIIGIVAGILLSTIPSICCIRISLETPIFDVFTLFVTIILAIYVASVLEKENQNSQFSKQMYITKIEQNESVLSSINDYIEQDTILLSRINNIILRYRIIQNTLHTSLKENDKKGNFIPDCKAIEDSVKELNILLTMTPIDSKETSNIKITNGVITYSDKRKTEITTCLCKIDTLFFKMKYKINNLL